MALAQDECNPERINRDRERRVEAGEGAKALGSKRDGSTRASTHYHIFNEGYCVGATEVAEHKRNRRADLFFIDEKAGYYDSYCTCNPDITQLVELAHDARERRGAQSSNKGGKNVILFNEVCEHNSYSIPRKTRGCYNRAYG